MAAILRSAAAAASNKGMPSSFYSKDKPNPVLQSLDKEIKEFIGFIKKRKAKGYKKPDEEAQSRPADTLFEIWNKYEPRLPKSYYQEKLLEVGDFLMSVQEFSLALWQCYDRYLMHFGDASVTEITDVETFKSIFFPGGFDGDNAGLTVAKVSKLLIELEKGHITKYKGKSLDEIQFDLDEPIEEETEKKKEKERETVVDRPSATRRLVNKKQWSEEEGAAVARQLGKYFHLDRLPGKNEIVLAQQKDPVLSKRPWSQIKFYVKNKKASKNMTRH